MTSEKLPGRYLRSRSLFHAKGRDGERAQRWGNARHGRHRRFDSDVVRAWNAAANTDPMAGSRLAVHGRAAGDGVHQVLAGQDLSGFEAFGREPRVQNLHHPIA